MLSQVLFFIHSQVMILLTSRSQCLCCLLSGRYFDEISQDTGKFCFGVEDTLRALELGSVETLICWENLDIQRYVLKNHASSEEKVLHLTPEQEKDKSHFTDKEVSWDTVLLVVGSFI